MTALPAAGSRQGSDTPIPPSRCCGAGGPHTGGARDGRGLSGTEDQAYGSTTKRFMRLDQGPRQGSPVEEGGTHASCPAGRRGRTGSLGDRRSRREPRRPPGPARRGHPDAPPPAPGKSECRLGWELLGERTSPPAQTADRRCSGPARRTWLPPFLCSRGGCLAPSLKRRCFLKGPEVKQEAPSFLGGDFAHLEKQALLGG